jgi:hypothetical protein
MATQKEPTSDSKFRSPLTAANPLFRAYVYHFAAIDGGAAAVVSPWEEVTQAMQANILSSHEELSNLLLCYPSDLQ